MTIRSRCFNPIACLRPIILSSLFLLGAGCSSSLLPMVEGRVESPWESFAQAKQAFDKITPDQTSAADLQALDFAPFRNPNIEIVTHLGLIKRFMPSASIRKDDLPAGIKSCIESNNSCYGYELKISRLLSKRCGSVFLDLFNFKRSVHKTGWEFEALLVINNDRVVYKLWSGKPQIDEFTYSKNPLGPLQESETMLTSMGTSLF